MVKLVEGDAGASAVRRSTCLTFLLMRRGDATGMCDGGILVGIFGNWDGIFCILDRIFGISNGIFGNWDGIFEILDGIFGISNGIFGNLDEIFDILDGIYLVIEMVSPDEERRCPSMCDEGILDGFS